MIKKTALVLILALSVIAAGCNNTTKETAAPPLRVGWFLWPGWYPIVIAEKKGFFAKHGVEVEPVLYEAYTDIFSDFAAGKLDAAHGGLYELLKSNISTMKVVLATDYSDGAEGLVVTPDITTPQDLKGKRIGIQGALSGSEFIITTLLRRHGLSRNDLILVDVGPEIVLETMPERIQGGYTWEPFLSLAKKRGYKVLFTTADTPGMVPDVIAFQENVIKRRKADVQAFVDAWFEAQEYWLNNREEGDAIIADATGQDRRQISLDGCRVLTRKENQAAFRDDGGNVSLYKTGKRQIEFFISVGDASTAPVIQEALSPDFVR